MWQPTRRRSSGQVVVAFMLVLAGIMVAVALAIDLGNMHRVRAQTQYVCDAAALGGLAEFALDRAPEDAADRAYEIAAANGYEEGKNGVTSIDMLLYSHLQGDHPAGPPEDPSTIDRLKVTISRELPQSLVAAFGPHRTGVTVSATAAGLGAGAIDVDFDAGLGVGVGNPSHGDGDAEADEDAPLHLFGFPTTTTPSQFGPDGDWALGDPFNTTTLPDGNPNPQYSPTGQTYDIYLPDDFGAPGHTVIRIELFDPDTINAGPHVVKRPDALADTDGNLAEPELGGLDEILAPPPNSNANTNANTFPARSTQTEFKIVDSAGTTVALASYGPDGNTPFWYQNEAPSSHAAHVASHADPARAQIATDLRWVTPSGFEFDTAGYVPPFKMMARTVSGSSENGYSARVGFQRGDGQQYNPVRDGLTETSALSIYARGRVVMNFPDMDITLLPLAGVPEGATEVIISNFDTEVGASSLEFKLTSYDTTTGQGNYPVLWPAPPTAPPSKTVSDAAGNKYWFSQTGTRSPTKQWRTDTIPVPDQVVVPRTDGHGNLVFDAQGRIVVVDQRPFEGGEVEIWYEGGARGAHDTSAWEVGYHGNAQTAGSVQQIVLIR